MDVCIECGSVAKRDALVSHLEFSNSKVIGFFLTPENRDARAMRMNYAIMNLEAIASTLSIKKTIVEAG
jgi:hypothetical protein